MVQASDLKELTQKYCADKQPLKLLNENIADIIKAFECKNYGGHCCSEDWIKIEECKHGVVAT